MEDDEDRTKTLQPSSRREPSNIHCLPYRNYTSDIISTIVSLVCVEVKQTNML